MHKLQKVCSKNYYKISQFKSIFFKEEKFVNELIFTAKETLIKHNMLKYAEIQPSNYSNDQITSYNEITNNQYESNNTTVPKLRNSGHRIRNRNQNT